ncbi:MAG: hypothetical protein IKP90_06870 [Fibrobacter sp.]|jgi:hypothetical protein|nr:hypothetical protein [Fibrobacter sp.]
MKSLLTKIFAIAVLLIAFVSCSDEDEGTEFLFDREIMEMSVLRSCVDEKDTSACYRIRFRLPIEKEDLSYIHVWLDTTVIDDTSKAVTSKQIGKADTSLEYGEDITRLYDTLDLTDMVKEYLETYKSLQVAFFCEYSDDEDPGSVQRVILHFGDSIPPANVTFSAESTWTDGIMFEWYRPTDQTDFYKMSELSGIIVGYNVVIYSEDKSVDLRDIKVTVTTAEGVDSTGTEFYRRHARVRATFDSVWIDTALSHTDKDKNKLRIAVLDGKGFDFENDSLNRYRMVVEGLRPNSIYTVGITAWDSAGNSSSKEDLSTVDKNKRFDTTDSIAPVMAKKLFFMEDTLFPGMARLDSNNRLRIFWSMSVDPYKTDHPVKSDSVIDIPDSCLFTLCYDTVATYVVEHYDVIAKEWKSYLKPGDTAHFNTLYVLENDTMTLKTDTLVLSAIESFVTDTIRWVSPGDTIIFRIRSKDKSGYYSAALIDTVYVSPGALASELNCPEGFVPVSAGDSLKFCMERYEHRDDSGAFVNNVLHSEAVAACEAVSASGFTVSLCKERDWELVCLSGGTLAYGVLNERSVDATEYLFSYCNVGTNDSISAADVSRRDYRCTNPMGVKDMPGQYQEWVIGRSEDTVAVAKGSSYKVYGGLDRESLALCTNRSFPYYTRLAYTTDTVYLYREGAKVDTVFAADTSRTLYKKLSKKDFKDSLQFFDVQDSAGNTIGEDYALYSEYKQGGDEWLDTLGNGLKYVPTEVKVVFLTGDKVSYRQAAAFYKSPTIGFRCCAYPE